MKDESLVLVCPNGGVGFLEWVLRGRSCRSNWLLLRRPRFEAQSRNVATLATCLLVPVANFSLVQLLSTINLVSACAWSLLFGHIFKLVHSYQLKGRMKGNLCIN